MTCHPSKFGKTCKKSFSNSLPKLLANFPDLLSVVAAHVYLRVRIGVAILIPRISDFLPARADNSAASSRAPQGRPVSIYFDPSVLTASTSSSRSVACDGAKEPGRRRAQHPVVAALGDIGRRQEPRSVLGDRPAPVVAKNPDQVPAASAIRYPASSFPRRSPCLLDLVARVPPLVQL